MPTTLKRKSNEMWRLKFSSFLPSSVYASETSFKTNSTKWPRELVVVIQYLQEEVIQRRANTTLSIRFDKNFQKSDPLIVNR